MTEKEKLFLSAMKDLTKQQSSKIDFINKRLSRQNRIIKEYDKINKELEKECSEFNNIMKKITKEYNKQLKNI